MEEYYNSGISSKVFDYVHVSGDLSYAGPAVHSSRRTLIKKTNLSTYGISWGRQSAVVAARAILDGNKRKP